MRSFRRALLGGRQARPRLPSRVAQIGLQSRARARQAPARPQPAPKAENLPNANPALPHRLRCALHQQPGRTGPQDDEGQNENLRRVPNPRRRSNLRTPQIRRLHREKTPPQHPPNPHRYPRSHHRRPYGVTDGLGVTNRGTFPGGKEALTKACFKPGMSPDASDSLERMTPTELVGLVRRLLGEVDRLRAANEKLSAALAGLRVENQTLKDEIARLKRFAAASAAQAFRNGEGDGSARGRSRARRGWGVEAAARPRSFQLEDRSAGYADGRGPGRLAPQGL